MASMNYFDFDMYNSTNTVVCFDGKDGNFYLRLRAMSHTLYAAKFEQTITFTTGKSVLLIIMTRDTNIMFARFNCTSYIY
jgi:hypothetical protein